MKTLVRATVVFLLVSGLSVCSTLQAATEAQGSYLTGGAEAVSTQEPGTQRRTLKAALLTSAFLLGSVAAIMEVESDRAYSRYLDVANPVKMDSYYDKAERYRGLSSGALIGAEICAVAFVVLSLSEKPRKDEQPGTVRITVPTRIPGVGVSVVW